MSYISSSLSSLEFPKYFVRRSAHDVVMKALDDGFRDVIVHSDMANGKTSFLKGVACDLIKKGNRVFWMEREGVDVQEDYDNLLSISEPLVLIFENVVRHLKDVKYLRLRAKNNLTIIGSSKSVFYENKNEELQDAFLGNGHFEVDLDHLNESEIKQLSDIFSQYKFWAEKDALPEYQKIDFLTYNCNSSFGSILLEIIKSPNIQSRFSSLFQMYEDEDGLGDILTTASVLTLLNFDVTDFFVLELTGNNYIYKSGFRSNPTTKEIFNVSNGKIIPKSSVLAKFALTNHSDSKKIVDRLIKIAKRAHDLRGFAGFEGLFFDIYKSLVTFSVLQSMLPEKGKRDSLIRFYENVKNFEAAKNHPHFWLQYAIARLAYDDPDDLTKAKLYLDTAYSHAKRIGDRYHTNHMDNVHARYLMKHGIQTEDADNAIVDFRQAHAILLRQARNEKNEKPYRVARLYSQLFQRRFDELSHAERIEIQIAAQQLITAANHVRVSGRNRETINHCRRDLESIVRTKWTN